MDAALVRRGGGLRRRELHRGESEKRTDRDRAAGARRAGLPCRTTQPNSSMMIDEPVHGKSRGAACCAPTFSLSCCLLWFLAVSLPAQDSTFLLTTTDPTYRTPAFIGNGAFSLVGSPLGTTPRYRSRPACTTTPR